MTLQRVINGDAWRKSRLHDMRGNFIGPKAVVEDLPKVLLGAAERRALGIYPALPWNPFPVIRKFEEILQPGWSVFENGAGMSTIWWAQHVKSVYSIEPNREWHGKVQAELDMRGLKNVTLEFRPPLQAVDVSQFADKSFDIVLIDGPGRDHVAEQALRIIKRPGWIYLDNADFSEQWPEMYGLAEEAVARHAQSAGGTVSYFTGMPPATFVATQGMLASFPR